MRITKGTRGYGKKAAAMILALAIAATSVPAAAMASADTSSNELFRVISTEVGHVSEPLRTALKELEANSGNDEGYEDLASATSRRVSSVIENEIKAITDSLCERKKTD